MFSLKRIAGLAAAALFVSSVSCVAAVVVDKNGPIPGASFLNPIANATTGTVYQNIVRSRCGGGLAFCDPPGDQSGIVARSPWEDQSNYMTGTYTSVQGGGSATYNITNAPPQYQVSFLWGSPDDYNDLVIQLIGAMGTETINGSTIAPPSGSLARFVTITSDTAFQTVKFTSGTNAFEFANFASAVPLPDAGLLLFGALGHLEKPMAWSVLP
jgi:hypothetical protein